MTNFGQAASSMASVACRAARRASFPPRLLLAHALLPLLCLPSPRAEATPPPVAQNIAAGPSSPAATAEDMRDGGTVRETHDASRGPGSLGFDRNTFPGDASLPVLRRHFSFVGYWLNVPPGARDNSWRGRRSSLREAGFGFLVLWNGRLDAAIKRLTTSGSLSAEALGRRDAAAAVAAARQEGFPVGTIVFLDQEEGGRLLPEQMEYVLGWTEAIATSPFRPGVYASGQPVPDGSGADGKPQTITTADHITAEVRSRGLHPVALWVAQDSCGPSPGCTLAPPPLDQSGTPGALVWQYAQSPRRPALTRSCARTYAADGNCSVPELPADFLDLNVSSSSDPSHGR